jgi:arsenate reductase
MKDIQIWHNPRYSKSRASFALLEEKKIDAEVINYLNTPHSVDEIKALLVMLEMEPRELMRTKEEIYKKLNLKDEDNSEALIKAMSENPKLIERPIVIKGDRAVIGRPIENVIELLG